MAQTKKYPMAKEVYNVTNRETEEWLNQIY